MSLRPDCLHARSGSRNADCQKSQYAPILSPPITDKGLHRGRWHHTTSQIRSARQAKEAIVYNMAGSERRKRPTSKDVAQLAGVSFKTVSCVVNREPGVQADTRDAVLSAMETLGYSPNVAARRLASRRSYLIVLLVRGAHSDYSAALQAGAQRRCRELGYHLIVETVTAGDEDRTIDQLCALGVDGVLVTAPHPRDGRLVEGLRTAGLRHVLISPAGQDGDSPSVEMDDEQAGMEMTRHLIGLGHREIAFLGMSAVPASACRRAGYVAALGEAGLSPRPEHDLESERGFRSAMDSAERLLDTAPRPTAIFAWNDVMALAVMIAAARRGLQIPDQLSVAGFDDSPAASFVWPSLTTVRQPLPEMAEAGIDILVSSDDPDPPPHLSFPFELIVRESTATRPEMK
jgi:LacI family transcriptional regulator